MKIHKKKAANPSFKERLKKKTRIPEMQLSDRFSFGKYKDWTLRATIESDPDYIKWLVDSKGILLCQLARVLLVLTLRKQEEKRAREQREREREERERRRRGERERTEREEYFKDAHDRYGWDRFFSGQSRQKDIDKSKIHPAYCWDDLSERERAGRILRLTGKVTREDIKSQYRKLALVFHPDKCGQMDEIFQETARIMFLQVQKAYEYFQKSYDL